MVFMKALLVFFIFSNNLFALDSRIQELMNSPTRPTIADLKRVFNPWPSENPFGPNLVPTPVEREFENLADTIVNFERLFPKAIYLVLGRDSAGFGDYIDAFYTKIGQPGRVKRVDFSRDTVEKSKDHDIVDYFKGLGLDLDKLESAPSFVLLDGTYYATSSQLGQILKIIYSAYQARGGDRKAIFKKFRGISLYAGISVPMSKIENPGAAFDAMAEKLEPFERPADILSVPKGISNFSDGLEWNYSFGILERDETGTVFVPPSRPHIDHKKMLILSHLFEVIEWAENSDFTTRVKALAKFHDVDIDIKDSCGEALAG